MDGVDHMSRSKMLIGRLREHDLKNGQSTARHAAGTDG
jgi:hypothetical protein